ncbi:FecR family protein [Pseudoflavitalea sp. X16]|uniref:FecR family protein n=1 Tax=Paraflavitalea devenefica TaxID=2716334 RepID=UPI00142412B7|nr:FecR domain-containing protein [Paraflavitalea devenefica]NII23971.1 FecR family protein [Paraflavitalea devenefica]
MQTTEIRDLLEKYKEGTITKEELVLLESWYLQWEPEATEIAPEELETLKDEVWHSIKPRHQKVVHRPRWKPLAAAASVLLLISSTLYIMLTRQAPIERAKEPSELAGIPPDYKPGAHRAVLTLSDNRQVVLKDSKNGMIGEDAGMTIYNNVDGELSYNRSANQSGMSAGKDFYNTLSTPRAGHFQVTLADGTKVWLNAASSITYPLPFSKEERKVSVIGEVYFEVAHRENHPFKVISGRQEITVLGTHFNIRSYDDEPGISTTLLVGSVRITNTANGSSGLLRPGQQASLSRTTEKIDIRAVNAEDAISWKNGYFLFDNQDLTTIMKNISRWYDVDVEFTGALGKERFGGTFSRSSNLSQLLQNMEKIGNVHFQLSGPKIIVSKKVNQ